MRHNRRSLLVWGAVLLLVLVSLACSASGSIDVEGPLATAEAGEKDVAPTSPPATEEAAAEATEAPEEESPPTEAAAATEEAATEEAATEEAVATEQAAPAQPESDGDPLEAAEIPELQVTDLDPRGDGLGYLGTFRQRMQLSFIAEGSDYTGIYTYDSEVNTADQAVHLTVSAEGAAAKELPANTLQVIWIGTRMWAKIGNQPWLPVPESVSALPFDEQVLSAGNFLPYVQTFTRVDERTVNGVACAYYTYDAQNLPTQYGTVDGAGDICVALDGGYVVRYTLSGSGTFDAYFEGDGTVELTYDTYDVGASITITPPRR